MRIVVHGQQEFGKAVLEALLDRGDDVVGVYCAPDNSNGTDPLKEFALEKGFEVNQPANWKDEVVQEKFKSHKADLCVMAHVTRLVPGEVLDLPTHGSIQYHPSLLPMHRGPSAINWPIIHGEKKTGLSVFWPDKGLDSGPILLQKEVLIDPLETAGTLYFDALFPMGVKALLEAVDMVQTGSAPRIEQDSEAGSYEGWCRSENMEIDWSKPAPELFNLIRGCDPQPGAWTVYKGQKLQIYNVALNEGISAAPGEVVGTDSDTLKIAAGTGGIVVNRVRVDGGDKIAANRFMEASGIKTGEKMGDPL